MIYFIGDDKHVKIGISSDPVKRIKGIQTGNPVQLSILATCDTGDEDEKRLHKLFASFKSSGEWFNRNPQLDFVIEYLSSFKNPKRNHLVNAFNQFQAFSQRKRDPLDEDLIIRDALMMFQVDIYHSGKSVNSIQLRKGIGYYREILVQLGTLNYLCQYHEKLKKWRVLLKSGKLRFIDSYFNSDDYLQSVRSDVVAIPTLKTIPLGLAFPEGEEAA